MRLSVRVTPRAKQNAIKYDGTLFRVRLTAPPVDGKANEALVDFLVDEFALRRSDIKIISGHSTRGKVIEIAHPTPALLKRVGQQKCL